MKSKLLSLAVAVLIFSVMQAQSIHLGIKVGTNINKISGETFSQKFTYGYHLGGFAEIGLGGKWRLQPEILFNELNADTSSQFSKIYTSMPSNINNIKLRYLSIPILLDYKVSKIFVLQAGPQFGILMNHDNSLVQDGKAAFKKGDFSMLAGIQLKIASIRIYGRYAIGLSNINDIDNKEKWKSQSFQLGIGLALL